MLVQSAGHAAPHQLYKRYSLIIWQQNKHTMGYNFDTKKTHPTQQLAYLFTLAHDLHIMLRSVEGWGKFNLQKWPKFNISLGAIWYRNIPSYIVQLFTDILVCPKPRDHWRLVYCRGQFCDLFGVFSHDVSDRFTIGKTKKTVNAI